MTNKMTKKMALTAALTYVPDSEAEVRSKILDMIAQLDKKNASPKKLTANQEQNLILRDAVVVFLETYPDEMFTCSDLAKRVPELNGASPQKVSALMSALVKVEKVERVQDKRKTYFKVKGA